MKKITYTVRGTESNSRYLVNFRINQNISKEHFKELVKRAAYNNQRKKGLVILHKLEDLKPFTDFLDTINEEVTPYRVEVIKEEKQYKTKQGISCNFHDYCVDLLNLKPHLHSTLELKTSR
jgi:hypothetical protein